MIVMAITEGVTEFLPISSTGHMIMAARLMNITETEFVKSFQIVIQAGAIAAVGVIYLKEVWQNKKLWGKIAAGFVPTAVIGLVLYKLVKKYLLGNWTVTTITLLVGGIFLLAWEKMKRADGRKGTIESISWKKAAMVGLGQSVSIIPGVSRSAASIVSGVETGLNREEAVKFSFLLAVPTMAAATGLDLVRSGWQFTPAEWGQLITGTGIAFVTAWLTVKWLLGYVKSHGFEVFGYYRMAAAVIFWLVTR